MTARQHMIGGGRMRVAAAPLAAAAATPGDFARRQRVCEANFPMAEYRLEQRDAAQALLHAAGDACPPGTSEAAFARAELERANSH